MEITIKERSQIARLAAGLLREEKMAVVLGRTVHLWNSPKKELLENKKWLQHELAHVHQFQQYGFIRFLLLYGWESLKKGYHKNRFEIEAREKENNKDAVMNISLK